MSKSSCNAFILIVEDDYDVRESISEVLRDNEYRPIAAVNGKEAIDRLRAVATKPCVILLDIMMPVMDGWQFRALQKEDPDLESIPVVILTAHPNIREAAAGMQAEAFLKKPIQLEALLATVERFCRQAHESGRLQATRAWPG